MYTAVLQVIIYQLAKYEKDWMKNGRETAEPKKWERNKRKINKKEKTIQQQKGPPTLSADLNNVLFSTLWTNMQYYCICGPSCPLWAELCGYPRRLPRLSLDREMTPD